VPAQFLLKPAHDIVFHSKAPAAIDTSLGLALELTRLWVALHLLLALWASQKKHFFHQLILK
jgi:hypothetical protein